MFLLWDMFWKEEAMKFWSFVKSIQNKFDLKAKWKQFNLDTHKTFDNKQNIIASSFQNMSQSKEITSETLKQGLIEFWTLCVSTLLL